MLALDVEGHGAQPAHTPRRAVVRFLLVSTGLLGAAAFATSTAYSTPGALALARRALVLAVPALLAGKPADASYMMSQAAQQAHSWEATGKEKELATYARIQDTIDEKRRFRENDDGDGGLGSIDHSNYRRGDARDIWEEQHHQQRQTQQSNLIFTSETTMRIEDGLMLDSRYTR